MAWEEELFALFDDLEQQAESLYDPSGRRSSPTAAARRTTRSRLASRLMASIGARGRRRRPRGGPAHRASWSASAPDWLLLRGPAQDWIVPLAAVQVLHGASARSVPEPAWSPVARLGLGSALRRARRGARSGACCTSLDGTRHEAVLVRVGADFVEARIAGDAPCWSR